MKLLKVAGAAAAVLLGVSLNSFADTNTNPGYNAYDEIPAYKNDLDGRAKQGYNAYDEIPAYKENGNAGALEKLEKEREERDAAKIKQLQEDAERQQQMQKMRDEQMQYERDKLNNRNK
jgi:hypothetical protein